jgi:hypothetical protein
MKPIIAIASMMLGTASMGSVVYLASNPNAFLTRTPQAHSRVATSVLFATDNRTNAVAATPSVIQIEPIQITGRGGMRSKALRATTTDVSAKAEAVLSACSDWRPLGPAATDSERVSGEHQVKLLCPSGANAQDTFMVGLRDPGARKLR